MKWSTFKRSGPARQTTANRPPARSSATNSSAAGPPLGPLQISYPRATAKWTLAALSLNTFFYYRTSWEVNERLTSSVLLYLIVIKLTYSYSYYYKRIAYRSLFSGNRQNKMKVYLCPVCWIPQTKLRRHLQRKHEELTKSQINETLQKTYSRKRKAETQLSSSPEENPISVSTPVGQQPTPEASSEVRGVCLSVCCLCVCLFVCVSGTH